MVLTRYIRSRKIYKEMTSRSSPHMHFLEQGVQKMANASCPGHGNHMCELMKAKKIDEVKAFAKNAQYICLNCGRAATKAENLCKPEKI